MSEAMVATKPSPNGTKLGQRVRFKFGLADAEGEVIEDRGPLAEDRKHLYRVKFRFSEGDEMMVELTEDEFEKLPLAA